MRTGGKAYAGPQERHGWEKADGPAIVSDLIAGGKKNLSDVKKKKEKKPSPIQTCHQKGKARRSLRELEFGERVWRNSGGL